MKKKNLVKTLSITGAIAAGLFIGGSTGFAEEKENSLTLSSQLQGENQVTIETEDGFDLQGTIHSQAESAFQTEGTSAEGSVNNSLTIKAVSKDHSTEGKADLQLTGDTDDTAAISGQADLKAQASLKESNVSVTGDEVSVQANGKSDASTAVSVSVENEEVTETVSNGSSAVNDAVTDAGAEVSGSADTEASSQMDVSLSGESNASIETNSALSAGFEAATEANVEAGQESESTNGIETTFRGTVKNDSIIADLKADEASLAINGLTEGGLKLEPKDNDKESSLNTKLQSNTEADLAAAISSSKELAATSASGNLSLTAEEKSELILNPDFYASENNEFTSSYEASLWAETSADTELALQKNLL
ncbi:hypothetical protein DFO73_102337 [Cytobacillus oceanisediminis]|uniref:Uncharacterized protein n=1 Tax=Cytobacillus oceanisediminis TaxID=665099 RepID=A0A2V3A3P6_9BACI|nr:hypothetical protein [Cytobacillus oceanisediminis]PWW31341.1 hypothetical protein DFO73_102337 [Cytobacillus oceanisediminis]